MQAMAPTLFALYASRDVDWVDPHNVMMLRLLFAGSIVLQLVAGLVVWLRVQAANDRRPVAVPAPAAGAPPAAPLTVREFDLAEVRKYAQSIVTNAAFLGFLNYKFDMTVPVYFQVESRFLVDINLNGEQQIFMGLFRIYDWEMFRIHVLGVRDRAAAVVAVFTLFAHQETAAEYPALNRPFPVPPNPLAGLMSAFNGPSEEAGAAPAVAAAAAGGRGAQEDQVKRTRVVCMSDCFDRTTNQHEYESTSMLEFTCNARHLLKQHKL